MEEALVRLAGRFVDVVLDFVVRDVVFLPLTVAEDDAVSGA